MTRDRLISRIRRWARRSGVPVEVDRRLGKGSHYRLRVGGRVTIIKSGDLKPGYVALVLKQLGIPPDEI